MKIRLTISLLFLFAFGSLAQRKPIPKNLKQALKILNVDCSDSLKSVIKKTSDDKLINLCYPWSENISKSYRTISDWLDGEHESYRIDKYLAEKGIKADQNQQTVILIAFKKKLLGQPVNEKEIFKPYQDIELKWDQEDKVRSTTDSLRGIYIPKDLEDCFKQLNNFFNDSVKTKIKSLTEDEFTGKYHFSVGRWMRNNWGLWQGSRLSAYFTNMGVSNPESMSFIILENYHRTLLEKPIRFDKEIERDKIYVEKAKQKELENKKAEFKKYNIGDTVEYKYDPGFISEKQEKSYNDNSCIAKGLIIAKEENKFYLKIKIVETCDPKGLITYDDKDALEYDKELKKLVKIKKRKVEKCHKKDQLWFPYDMWDSKE